jgi:tRNA (guanine9-N1)-methyltransferase
MESDERPAKMRKLEHADEDVAPIAEAAPAAPTAGEQVPVTTGNSEAAIVAEEATGGEIEAPKISKNQLKKQRRLDRWEAGRDDRKVKRKEKIKEKKERRREAYAQAQANGEAAPVLPALRPPRHTAGNGTQVPITVVFDCDFEDLMFDNELKSLGLQITRCYSDNRKANFRTHLALSSFGGKMKERFDGILAQQYTSWKGFRFFEEDFVAVAEKSKEWMAGPKGGEIAGALKDAVASKASEQDATEGDAEKPQDALAEGEVIYLSSESDNVLTHLTPGSTYIIGGLVDKNRHKGICHKRAVARGIKTAKLPIGEFLEMKSRQVLVTNHVLEIMLKWMEFGDWGKAFMTVLPERKGAKLKQDGEGNEAEADADAEADANADPTDQEMTDATKEAEAVSSAPVAGEDQNVETAAAEGDKVV